MPRTSYTLFLAKKALHEFGDYLSPKAKERIGKQGHQSHIVENLGEQAVLHVFRGNSGPPPWMKRLSIRVPNIELENRQSVAGLLFVRVGPYVIILSFAHGWMLLNEDFLEADFGLKVAINALDPEKLKRLERSNLGDALQGVSQSPFQREFTSFGVDDALDLVKKLSGAAVDASGLDTITGSKSLKLTGDYSLDDVIAMVDEIVVLFQSLDYQNTVFGLIDSVRPVTDRVVVNSLFQLAVQSIKANEDRFELGLPSISEAEGVSFRFKGPRLTRAFPDLLLRHYVAAMGGDITKTTVETLTKHKIVSDFEDDRPSLSWPLKKALLGSISKDGQRYAINDGQWYRIDDTFRTSVEKHFDGVVQSWNVPKPSPIKKFFDAKDNGKIEVEADYNARIAAELGLVLLDKTEISIPDVIRSGFEPCDLLDVPNKRFIHVKKSSRRSNILSHFFKQGSNSAQQFRKVDDTWVQLAKLVRGLGFDAQADTLEKQVGIAVEGWTVEYWIADVPRVGGDFNIPFFSKISLRDEAMDLRAMQFNVVLRFIEVTPEKI